MDVQLKILRSVYVEVTNEQIIIIFYLSIL
jgi:hypothetical protein